MALDFSTLNDPQREAVETLDGPLLVLAGAGSGKTRVLTYRIANLLETERAYPWQILAITFTNKAAREMRDRLVGLIGGYAKGMWVCTFHSMCVRILRKEAERIGFFQNFTIYDDDDSKRLVRDIMANLDINEKFYPVQQIRARISAAKNELIVPGEFAELQRDPVGKQAARVYRELQSRLKASNAFDFDDLLMYTWLLLKHHPEVLEAYQNAFRYILVDEYQDTNHAQYEICRMLAAAHKNIMVVGDDDQSIYSWRGADVRNILDFEKDYPSAHVVKLEENYRSVGNILDAANAVIAHNKHRKPKTLRTSREKGDKISVYAATDERDEGRWIAGEIDKLYRRSEVPYHDIAVFYRTNAQSRMLEDMFLRAGIPYHIVGGTPFFGRAEIRDVMAYLNLVVNPADDVSAKRVINTPRRGIGKTTIETITRISYEEHLTFLEAAEQATVDTDIRPATRRALASFVSLINEARTFEGELRKVIEMIIDRSGIVDELKAVGTDEALSRIENIQEFYGFVEEYSDTHDQDDAPFEAPDTAPADAAEAAEPLVGEQAELALIAPKPPVRVFQGDSLSDFVEWVRLRTDLDSTADSDDSITMMTIHASKGLEFDYVFVAGMEEGIFPHTNTKLEESAIEEERRLAYVAITRARKKLHLTRANSRKLYGATNCNPASRFLMEIPSELRSASGLGSSGFTGTGHEKRGSRRGISGSGAEAGGGSVFNRSSASGSRGRSDRDRGSGSSFGGGGKPAKKEKLVLAKGDRIEHKTFGRGTVMKADAETCSVKFDKTKQSKQFLIDFAPIVKLG